LKQSAGATLRSILHERRAVLVPGVMNALAARIADDEGFEALYVTGAGLTNAFMGKPDVGLIDLTQIGLNLAMIRDVTELPLIVDADTGFGNAVNVYHTIRALERAGANAVQIEDQSMPKRCGHFDGKSVISADEMGQKVKAAVDARRSQDMLVVARTDAYAAEGLEAAIERALHFIECGADVTFVEAPRSVEDFKVICDRLPVPQIANIVIGGKTQPAAV
jgi:2-methylisocitrate lyase-like PEP mutase family enzyme